MNIAIRYYTQTGNTKKLAEAISAELDAEAEDVSCPLEEPTDVLFLCNSVYWAGIDKKVKRFVQNNAPMIGTLINVSTAALIESTYKQMKTVTAEAGVTLLDREFHCRGKFKALHASHPNEEDLEAVRAFARSVIESKKLL